MMDSCEAGEQLERGGVEGQPVPCGGPVCLQGPTTSPVLAQSWWKLLVSQPLPPSLPGSEPELESPASVTSQTWKHRPKISTSTYHVPRAYNGHSATNPALPTNSELRLFSPTKFKQKCPWRRVDVLIPLHYIFSVPQRVFLTL